jgi:hypothetical protein
MQEQLSFVLKSIPVLYQRLSHQFRLRTEYLTYMRVLVLLSLLCIYVHSLSDYQRASASTKDLWTQIHPSGTIRLDMALKNFTTIPAEVTDPESLGMDEEPEPLVRWVPIGHIASPIESLLLPFHAITVHLNASEPVHVYWSESPQSHASVMPRLQHARCGQWAWPFVQYPDEHCTITLPRFGWTAPIGRSYLGFVPARVSDSAASPRSWLASLLPGFLAQGGDSLTVTLEYRAHQDWRAMAVFVAGLLLFFASPLLAQSRAVHVTTGMALGSTGALFLVLFLLLRLLPGKRYAMWVTMVLGTTASLVGHIRAGLWALATEFQLLAACMLLAGAVAGAAVAYKCRLDRDSRAILGAGTKSLAMLMVFFSPHNVWLGAAVCAVLAVRWLQGRSQRHREADAEGQEQEQLYERPDGQTIGYPARPRRYVPLMFRDRLGHHLPLDDEDVVDADADAEVDADPDADSRSVSRSYSELESDAGYGYAEDYAYAGAEEPPEYLAEGPIEEVPSPYGGGRQSRAEFELEGRLHTQEELRRLRQRLRNEGGAHLGRLSARAIHAVAAELRETEEEDLRWAAAHGEDEGGYVDDLSWGREYSERTVRNAARSRVGARYDDSIVDEDAIASILRNSRARTATSEAYDNETRRRSRTRQPSYSRGYEPNKTRRNDGKRFYADDWDQLFQR